MAKTSSKKRKVIVDSFGEAHVTASFNNIIISLTNTKGEVISWSSAGKMRMHYIKLLPGDKVKLEMSPYDLTKARITYRY